MESEGGLCARLTKTYSFPVVTNETCTHTACQLGTEKIQLHRAC